MASTGSSKKHRDWIDAEYCINLDGGEFEKQGNQRLLTAIQASEKVYADFQLESLNPGGHSSVPSSDNAIYHLAAALMRNSKRIRFQSRSTKSRATIS